MDSHNRQIKVHRPLTRDEIDSINAVKVLAEGVGANIEVLEKMPDVDKRWLAIARTDLQKGFMSLTRAIARPTTF